MSRGDFPRPPFPINGATRPDSKGLAVPVKRPWTGFALRPSLKGNVGKALKPAQRGDEIKAKPSSVASNYLLFKWLTR